jgi:hypothetical protein
MEFTEIASDVHLEGVSFNIYGERTIGHHEPKWQFDPQDGYRPRRIPIDGISEAVYLVVIH